MYSAYFGLREEPFGVSPAPRFFFETEQHREALATLFYTVEQRRGLALLVGRAGLGKTSVLARLIQMVEGRAQVAHLPHPFFDRATMLETILMSLGLDSTASQAQNYRQFGEYLKRTYEAGKTCLVLFDEAQDLSLETIHAIRMLSNFETPSEKLVQIVMAGQPRLVDALQQPEFDQIRQRLNMVARLKPLHGGEVREYIAHRLKTAGSPNSLFSAGALDAIVSGAEGVPRNVNTICFNSLTLAYGMDQREVARDHVEEVLRDLDLSERKGPRALVPVSQTGLTFGKASGTARPGPITARLLRLWSINE
jgi:general secretion pathway protein A